MQEFLLKRRINIKQKPEEVGVVELRKALVIALVLVNAIVLWNAEPLLAAERAEIGQDTFVEVFNYIEGIHINSPESGSLYRGAIEGLIDTLDDPYTEYMTPEDFEEYTHYLDSTYVGVGIEILPGEGYPKILNAIDNTPAEKAGIKPGDLLIKVDGADVYNEPLDMVVQRVRGPEGTTVKLTIRREGREDFDLDLVRSSINTPTVYKEMLVGGTGYLRVLNFSAGTAGEFKNALTELSQEGAERLILDLRNNPGGYLQAAVQIAGNFIEPDGLVVSTVDRKGERTEYCTEEPPVFKGRDLAVLVDAYSASAAEILAGALQDHGVAVLVGDQTFGKGTVQGVIPLNSGGALKITQARYHTPKDRIIDGQGLTPDVQVLTPGLHIAAARRYLERPEKVTLTFELNSPEALVNGDSVALLHPVIQRSGEIYLPLRFVLEACGWRVDWQYRDGSIKISGSSLDVVFYPDGGRVICNGRSRPETLQLLNENGATYIPASGTEILGLDLKIDGSYISIEKSF